MTFYLHFSFDFEGRVARQENFADNPKTYAILRFLPPLLLWLPDAVHYGGNGA